MEWNDLLDNLHKALRKIDGSLVFDDTHRWINTDGFYELEVTLALQDTEIYLCTVYDYDGDLEKEFSSSNPQIVYEDTLIQNMDEEQLEDILETLETYSSGKYSKDDYRIKKDQLQYNYLLEE